jgi:hypothetical protein
MTIAPKAHVISNILFNKDILLLTIQTFIDQPLKCVIKFFRVALDNTSTRIIGASGSPDLLLLCWKTGKSLG